MWWRIHWAASYESSTTGSKAGEEIALGMDSQAAGGELMLQLPGTKVTAACAPTCSSAQKARKYPKFIVTQTRWLRTTSLV